MFMNRKALARLESWAEGSRRKPLVIRGARQVGKSTLVRLFAERAGMRLHEVNLERRPDLETTFASLDTARILEELELVAAAGPIRDAQSILFLDEVQATPAALPALRSVYEDRPGLHVIAAGSLLEFVLQDHAWSMPVGRVEYLFLEPMGFEEFLGAWGESALLDRMRAHQFGDEIGKEAHRQLVARLREFLICGGMPEAVAECVETESLRSVSDVHASILETYRDDFSKYARRADTLLIRRVFDNIPGALGSKVKYSAIDDLAPGKQVKRAFDLLELASVVRRYTHSDCTGIPLASTLRERAFKAYFLDVGLANTARGLPPFEPATMLRDSFVNEGPMAEQFVAQHLPLLAADNRRFVGTYWLREGRSNNAEVDFVLQIGAHICPIEVKAGRTGTLKSLQELVALRKWPTAYRFDMRPPSVTQVEHRRTRGGETVRFELRGLPLYMIEELPRMIMGAGDD